MNGISRGVVLTVTMLVAACSIAYELIIARTIANLAGNAVLWESVTIGVYILSLGVGALMIEKNTRQEPLKVLLRAEILLTLVGGLAAFLILAMHIIYRISYYDEGQLRDVLPVPPVVAFAVPAQFITALVGLLSGIELPALLAASEAWNDKRADAKVLAAYYGGTLLGTMAFGITHMMNLDDLYIGLGVALVNLCVAILIIPAATSTRGRASATAALVAVAGVLMILASVTDAFSGLHAKNFYYNRYTWRTSGIGPIEEFFPVPIPKLAEFLSRYPDIERHRTPYQTLDIVPDGPSPFEDGEDRSGFTLYINGRFQLSDRTAADYHEMLAHKPIELSGVTPHDILVLGAGDGVLAAELLSRGDVVHAITLVDIDPQMIALARTDHRLRDLNKGALDNPKLTVINDDAFNFLRYTDRQFDAVYFDVTFPFDFDTARLSSTEMFRMVLKRLKPNGFVATPSPLDMVDDRSGAFEALATGTLANAGIKSVIAFRARYDSFLLAATWPLPPPLDDGEVRMIDMPSEVDKAAVHSLLKPALFHVPDPFF